MCENSRYTFGRIISADLLQIDRLLAAAADFFETENEPAQIPADASTFDKLITLSPETIGLQKDEHEQIVGWCAAFPTTTTLMRSFLDRTITERVLFERTEAGNNGGIYVMSVFVLPAHRSAVNPIALVLNTIAPFLERNPAIFYHAWSEAGGRLGALTRKRYLKSHQFFMLSE